MKRQFAAKRGNEDRATPGDVAGARIYGGMHFSTSTVDGEKIGSTVAKHGAKNFFKPAH